MGKSPHWEAGVWSFQRDTMASHEAFSLGLVHLAVPTSSLFGFAYILSFYTRFAQISYEKCLNVPSHIPILPFTS